MYERTSNIRTYMQCTTYIIEMLEAPQTIAYTREGLLYTNAVCSERVGMKCTWRDTVTEQGHHNVIQWDTEKS